MSHWIVYHVASGHAFYSGAGLILLAVLLACFPRTRCWRRVRWLGVSLGAILVLISATPYSPAVYIALAAVTGVWIAGEATRRLSWMRWLPSLRVATACAWLAAIAGEVPYGFCPVVPDLERPVLGVLGDSVTAGMGDDEAVTWPKLLETRRGIPVHDCSQMGARVGSGLKQAKQLTAADRLVLIELGGNDLLGSGDAAEFAVGLDALLQEVCRPGRTVLMLELPLPPFCNEFGRIQRRLAARHGVRLVPKAVFLTVLTRPEATLDSIHLSQSGHEQMADAIWDLISTAYRSP